MAVFLWFYIKPNCLTFSQKCVTNNATHQPSAYFYEWLCSFFVFLECHHEIERVCRIFKFIIFSAYSYTFLINRSRKVKVEIKLNN
jgi:hypothetical protein